MTAICRSEQLSRKKKFIIIFSFVIAFAFLFVVCTDIPVFATTVKVVDNDDAQGHTVSSNGTWNYISASSLFYGDARISASGNVNYYYRYTFDHYVKTVGPTSLQLRVYLNHVNFTDPDAKYRIMHASGNTYNYLNQNNAAAGWNTVIQTTIGSTGTTYYYTGADVFPSENTGYNTGADGVEVSIG